MPIETDYTTLRSVINEHQPTGWAAEFGVYSGYSLGIIAEHMPVIGFDSFEGLPEDWREGFPKGTFSENTLRCLPYYPMNTTLVKGWFDETAPTFPFPALGLVHIDCDLYSSTVTALNAVTPHVSVGTVLVFDEFHGYPGHEDHESRAFHEWCAEAGVRCERIADGSEEAAFVITSLNWSDA